MMSLDIEALLAPLSAHPQLTLGVVFLASLLESIALIGTFVPGGAVVFAAGVLVGLGRLSPEWVLVLSMAGAILGDGISYWLGRHYRTRMRSMWLLQRRPELLERGTAFFRKHGGKSIFLGRFLPPVRAVVPVAAGVADMPPGRFYLLNVSSAVAWSIAHVAPGALFGASLAVAGAVSSRLMVLLVLIAALVWIAVTLVRVALRVGARSAERVRERMVARAKRRRGFLSSLVLSLLDPEKPEAPGLLLLAVALLCGLWLFAGTLEDLISNETALDVALYQGLQTLRNDAADAFMVVITSLGGVRMISMAGAAVVLWLLYRRLWRTAAYMCAALAAAALSIGAIKWGLARQRPTAIYEGISRYSFPSGHVLLSTVFYGFLQFVLARNQPLGVKRAVSSVAAVLIVLIAFSRLYLGAHWLSDVLGALGLGLAWVALLAMGYTHHAARERVPSLQVSAVVLATLTIAGSWSIARTFDTELARYDRPPLQAPATLGDWRTLPSHRTELSGEADDAFTVQWTGSASAIEKTMLQAGWRKAAPWSLKGTLTWLLPHPSPDELPALPRFDNGRAPALTFAIADGQNARHILRLWPSNYVAAAGEPVWLGTVSREDLRHPLGWVTTARPRDQDAKAVLAGALAPAAKSMTVARDGERQVLRVTSQ